MSASLGDLLISLRNTFTSSLFANFINALYFLARMHALERDEKKALDFLGLAVEHGFDHLSILEENDDFDIIRNTSEFQEIIRKIKDKT